MLKFNELDQYLGDATVLRKAIFFMVVVGTLMAFAIPAVASADVWTLNDELVGDENEAVTVDGTGTISTTFGSIEVGSCGVHYHGDVWNDPETGTGVGEITDFDFTAVHEVEGQDLCQAWLVEEEETVATVCDLVAAFTSISNPPFGAPWPLSVGSETAIMVAGVNFTNVFNQGCPLGAGAAVEGSITGTVVNGDSGSEITLNGTIDDLKFPTGGLVDLDGSVSITPTDGGTLDLD